MVSNKINLVQWTLANPNSLGPEPIQISEIFGLVKATVATCMIVTAPLGSLESVPLLQVHKTHNTAPKLSFSTLLTHLTHKTCAGFGLRVCEVSEN